MFRRYCLRPGLWSFKPIDGVLSMSEMQEPSSVLTLAQEPRMRQDSMGHDLTVEPEQFTRITYFFLGGQNRCQVGHETISRGHQSQTGGQQLEPGG